MDAAASPSTNRSVIFRHSIAEDKENQTLFRVRGGFYNENRGTECQFICWMVKTAFYPTVLSSQAYALLVSAGRRQGSSSFRNAISIREKMKTHSLGFLQHKSQSDDTIMRPTVNNKSQSTCIELPTRFLFS